MEHPHPQQRMFPSGKHGTCAGTGHSNDWHGATYHILNMLGFTTAPTLDSFQKNPATSTEGDEMWRARRMKSKKNKGMMTLEEDNWTNRSNEKEYVAYFCVWSLFLSTHDCWKKLCCVVSVVKRDCKVINSDLAAFFHWSWGLFIGYNQCSNSPRRTWLVAHVAGTGVGLCHALLRGSGLVFDCLKIGWFHPFLVPTLHLDRILVLTSDESAFSI